MGRRPDRSVEEARGPASKHHEPMPLISLPLERALLRRSMDTHEDQRHRCVHCHRTPLTGEVVHVYAGALGETMVCELCRPLRREAPARSMLMHAPEHDRSVRVTRRAA
jgi:hypothetical protein